VRSRGSLARTAPAGLASAAPAPGRRRSRPPASRAHASTRAGARRTEPLIQSLHQEWFEPCGASSSSHSDEASTRCRLGLCDIRRRHEGVSRRPAFPVSPDSRTWPQLVLSRRCERVATRASNDRDGRPPNVSTDNRLTLASVSDCGSAYVVCGHGWTSGCRRFASGQLHQNAADGSRLSSPPLTHMRA
jgi:hypothetical protein